MAFQPHRYTRTSSLLKEFAEVLSLVDKLIVLEVYSAGEAPILGADSQSLCHKIRQISSLDPMFVQNVNALRDQIEPLLAKDDVLIIQGAGNIGAIAKEMVNEDATQSSTDVKKAV
jgi:UDP-N-acetylmuramate--alanine ligase